MTHPEHASAEISQPHPSRVATDARQSISDLHLSQRVDSCLAQCLRSSLQRIEVTVYNRCVLLTGVVTSFYEKQLAQELVMRVPGVIRVENGLHVQAATGDNEVGH